jgi:hypothetical protein
MSDNKPTCKTYPNGGKKWFLNGKLHREDGPALEKANGDKEWFLNGKRHREDGPAVEWADGTKVWCLNGIRHREDGPAVERANGDKVWWLNGKATTALEVFKQAADEQRKHMLCFYPNEFSA